MRLQELKMGPPPKLGRNDEIYLSYLHSKKSTFLNDEKKGGAPKITERKVTHA